ncbi:MAG: Asp-tRNA(Asn)/Glu-tRNA(Gln) amidotransferase subunit GatC [Actinomycetota bacterium]
MSGHITPAEVARIAELARLRLTDDEIAHYTDHLEKVLDHAADLDEVDLDGITSTWQALPLTNVLRDDVVGTDVDPDEVLAAAPAAEDHQFRVPPILGEAP